MIPALKCEDVFVTQKKMTLEDVTLHYKELTGTVNTDILSPKG